MAFNISMCLWKMDIFPIIIKAMVPGDREQFIKSYFIYGFTYIRLLLLKIITKEIHVYKK